jgi:hypothetical protein
MIVMRRSKRPSRRILLMVGFSTAGLMAAGAVACSTSAQSETVASAANAMSLSSPALPRGVTLLQIDGGTNYYAHISPGSAWMDKHILVGAWLEQPTTATEVHYDVAMGNNIYWNLAGSPYNPQDYRVNYNVIRAAGMHVSAPDVTPQSGSETVAYEGSDESDMAFGAGWNGWTGFNPKNPDANANCIPTGSDCGFTVAKFFYTGEPTSDGTTGYPTGKKPIDQGYGGGVLFWDTNAEAATFLKYSDTLSADSYWMTDADLQAPSQAACHLLPLTSKECGEWNGPGLTKAERALAANYAYDVTRLASLTHDSKPVVVDVETGCPGFSGAPCIAPAATKAAAWHALIAGARGIIWFQDNLNGKCFDFRSFYDGSNPKSPGYNCQQTPGVTLHDVVVNVSAINHEIAALNSVLLAPFAQNYVSVGSADVSVMAKDLNGKFWVFAASGKPVQPPQNNQRVTFKIAGNYTGPVKVYDENRVLQAVDGVFTDTFYNQYSVHIYEIG